MFEPIKRNEVCGRTCTRGKGAKVQVEGVKSLSVVLISLLSSGVLLPSQGREKGWPLTVDLT